METKERIVFLDYLRIIACFMVMVVHSCEPFYLGGQGTLILSRGDALWVTLIDGALRASVPLFVMVSSYLLFPIRGSVEDFFRKRAKRIVVPFIFWSVMYAFVPLYGSTYDFYNNDSLWQNFGNLWLNFVGAAGHLWFVYMLLGVYLIMPVFSAWVEKVSRRGEEWFIALWTFTTLIPFLRLAAQKIYGLPELWGEANWNEFGMLYGVSGFIGFVVVGHYIRTYIGNLSWKKTLLCALPMLLIGWAISAGYFWSVIPDEYPVDQPLQLAVEMERSWRFCGVGPALMAVGYFLIARKMNKGGWIYDKVVVSISKASYGMYLMHIFFLCFFTVVIREQISCTPIAILSIALSSYITSFIVAKLISLIPKIGKWIVGC